MPYLDKSPGLPRSMVWNCRGRSLDLSQRIHLMGVVNMTPDSFSDQVHFASPEEAIRQALRMEEEGADILDVGGESTRPGASFVPVEEEIRRVEPVVRALVARSRCLISVDTRKAAVARVCLDAGAHILNDITALRGDPEMLDLVAESGAGVVLMHMLGEPATMQENPHYQDVEREVGDFLASAMETALRAGISSDRILLDPGIGFGKILEHNLSLLNASARLQNRLTRPLLLGVSRKRFIGALTGRPVEDRMPGSLATLVATAMLGVRIFRVHDVKESCDAARIVEGLATPSKP